MRFNITKEALARANGLTCTRCGKKYPVDVQYRSCLKCGGQLLLNLVLGEISKKVNRRIFAKREWSIWRYRELLPDINEEQDRFFRRRRNGVTRM